jgi:hypothetical protein
MQLAEGQSMQAQASADGQVWHIAATLLYDHEPREVLALLGALFHVEQSGPHRAAIARVAQAMRGWLA